MSDDEIGVVVSRKQTSPVIAEHIAGAPRTVIEYGCAA
jgi:hypothetical protein